MPESMPDSAMSGWTVGDDAGTGRSGNSPRRVLFASLIGTTIEFFDFYIYATAAVLVFPKLFFPAGDPASATLQSLATFALAFFARPIGSAVFGHFGDRIGRKATLVAALLTMGISTVLICRCRPTQSDRRACAARSRYEVWQRLGLAGEWGGAVLLATEKRAPASRVVRHVPATRRASDSCVRPASSCADRYLSDAEFFAWAGALPFWPCIAGRGGALGASALAPRTPDFQRAIETTNACGFLRCWCASRNIRVVAARHVRRNRDVRAVLPDDGFALSWGTSALGYARTDFLMLQMIGVLFFAVTYRFRH